MTYFCITLCISDLEEEIIVLKVQGGCTISELPSKVPTEGARYHLFRFKHTYEGDSFESNGEMPFVFAGTNNRFPLQFLSIPCPDILSQ